MNFYFKAKAAGKIIDFDKYVFKYSRCPLIEGGGSVNFLLKGN
jgi:hypothetical protein